MKGEGAERFFIRGIQVFVLNIYVFLSPNYVHNSLSAYVFVNFVNKKRLNAF